MHIQATPRRYELLVKEDRFNFFLPSSYSKNSKRRKLNFQLRKNKRNFRLPVFQSDFQFWLWTTGFKMIQLITSSDAIGSSFERCRIEIWIGNWRDKMQNAQQCCIHVLRNESSFTLFHAPLSSNVPPLLKSMATYLKAVRNDWMYSSIIA